MIGDLLEKSYMSDSSSAHCEAMIRAFAQGYGHINEQMALWTVIHAGVHMINWCSRHPEAELAGKAEVLMQRAVVMIVKAWRTDRRWFEGDILSCLFRWLNE